MRNTFRHDEEGQILLWVAFIAGILILFTAMAVDMANIYYHKARLSNAVDAAVLKGAILYGQNLSGGGQITQAQAQGYADDMFVANYGDSSPTRAYTWCPIDVVGCPPGPALSLTLKAQAKVNTSFMAYLPQWAQWTLGDTGQATRSTLVMTVVIDRSGSMCGGGVKCWEGQTGDDGGVALQTAVPNFVADFIVGTDYLALVSFASDARVDVPITQHFSMPIDSAIAAMNFDGGTFGTGAGTNSYNTSNGPPMSLADNQNNSVVLASGSPETKVVIYFTDGLMNAVQDALNCTNNPPGPTLYNYGGYDSGTSFDFLDPNGNFQGTNDIWPNDDYSSVYGCGGGSGGGGSSFTCAGNIPLSSAVSCNGVTKFPSQKTGGPLTFSRANITAEAQYRAITTASTMRQERPVPTYFFTIGLGSDVSTNPCVEAFLSTVANDPNGPTNYSCPSAPAVYNSSLPAGLFLVVPDCPSTACTTELNAAFQTIASKILLRLSE